MRWLRRRRADSPDAESVLRLTRERDMALDRVADIEEIADTVIRAAVIEDPAMREVELLAAVAALELVIGSHGEQLLIDHDGPLEWLKDPRDDWALAQRGWSGPVDRAFR